MNDKEKNTGGAIYMQIDAIRKRAPTTEGFTQVVATTSRGGIDFRYFEKVGAEDAVILVGGIGGGWDTPCKGMLYPKIAAELPKKGISVLWVKYRRPTMLAEAVLDALAGILFLEREGVRNIGLVGHSFGGAVAIQAASLSERVTTIVPLSTQGYGAHVAADIKEDVSALFMHGMDDEILPVQTSVSVHGLVRGEKEIILLNGTRHGLDEAADDVHRTVRDWLLARVRPDGDI